MWKNFLVEKIPGWLKVNTIVCFIMNKGILYMKQIYFIICVLEALQILNSMITSLSLFFHTEAVLEIIRHVILIYFNLDIQVEYISVFSVGEKMISDILGKKMAFILSDVFIKLSFIWFILFSILASPLHSGITTLEFGNFIWSADHIDGIWRCL